MGGTSTTKRRTNSTAVITSTCPRLVRYSYRPSSALTDSRSIASFSFRSVVPLCDDDGMAFRPYRIALLLFIAVHLGGCFNRTARKTEAPSARDIAQQFLKAATAGDEATATSLFDFESQVRMDQAPTAFAAMASHQFAYVEHLPELIRASLSPPQRDEQERRRTRRLMTLLSDGKCELGSRHV